MREIKHHYKMEFDVQTNREDVLDLLVNICDGVRSNLELHFAAHELKILPTVTAIEEGEGEGEVYESTR